MTETFFKAAFSALATVALNPLALVGYLAVILSYTIIAMKVKRNKNLLAQITNLPENDRLKALERIMDDIPVSVDIPPDVWLKARIDRYRHIRIWVTAGLIPILAVIASYTYLENKKIKDHNTINAVMQSEEHRVTRNAY